MVRTILMFRSVLYQFHKSQQILGEVAQMKEVNKRSGEAVHDAETTNKIDKRRVRSYIQVSHSQLEKEKDRSLLSINGRK